MNNSALCQFKRPWAGPCNEPAAEGATMCAKHAEQVCVVCGKPAMTHCGFASWLVCGAPLCGSKECERVEYGRH